MLPASCPDPAMGSIRGACDWLTVPPPPGQRVQPERQGCLTGSPCARQSGRRGGIHYLLLQEREALGCVHPLLPRVAGGPGLVRKASQSGVVDALSPPGLCQGRTTCRGLSFGVCGVFTPQFRCQRKSNEGRAVLRCCDKLVHSLPVCILRKQTPRLLC